MKIIQYCQHVLGIGHLFRSLEICRALSAHEVILVTGGPQVDAGLPEHVREVRLPDLQMNQEFKGLFSSQKDNSLEQIKADRQKCLLAIVEREKPDIFLVELYPFGRKAFRFELDPVLEALGKRESSPCGAICSVRDILVEKDPGTSVQLADDDALCAMYDKGPPLGNQWQLTKIHILLDDIFDRFLLVLALTTDQPHSNLEGSGEAHIALSTLFNAVSGRTEIVTGIFK